MPHRSRGRHAVPSPSGPGTRPTSGGGDRGQRARSLGLEAHRAGALQTATAVGLPCHRGSSPRIFSIRAWLARTPGCRSGTPSPAPSWPFCRASCACSSLKPNNAQSQHCGPSEASDGETAVGSVPLWSPLCASIPGRPSRLKPQQPQSRAPEISELPMPRSAGQQRVTFSLGIKSRPRKSHWRQVKPEAGGAERLLVGQPLTGRHTQVAAGPEGRGRRRSAARSWRSGHARLSRGCRCQSCSSAGGTCAPCPRSSGAGTDTWGQRMVHVGAPWPPQRPPAPSRLARIGFSQTPAAVGG